MLSATRTRRFWFPAQTKAGDGGTKPEISGSCSVSSAPFRIAFQEVLFSETFVAKAQLHFRALHMRESAAQENPLPTDKPDLTRGTL